MLAAGVAAGTSADAGGNADMHMAATLTFLTPVLTFTAVMAVCFLLSVPLIILQLLGERKRKTFR